MRKAASVAGAIASLALASAAQATVVYYNGAGGNSNFDVSYSTSPNADSSFSTGALTLGAATFINGGDVGPNYTASPSDTRYYGGTISFTQGNNQGYVAPDLSLSWGSASSGNPITFTLPDTSPAYWRSNSYQYPGQLTGTNPEANPGAMPLPGSITSFDFVMSISDYNYGPITIDFYLGANADSQTMPTEPDYAQVYNPSQSEYGTNGVSDLSNLTITLQGFSDDPTGSTLVTSNFFGSDVWTPVTSATPEPAGLSLLAVAGIGLLSRRRRVHWV